MQPRLPTSILPSGFRCGTFPGRSRPAKRLDIAHQLPALRFRQLRPNWHSLSNDTIRQDPENSAWRGALNFRSVEAWPPLTFSPRVTMAFGAVPFKENGPGSNCVRIILQRISAAPRFFRGLLQFRVDGRIVLGRCASRWFIGVPALR